MTNDTPLKKCSKCGCEFPATREYFYANCAVKDGLRPECKTCNNVQVKAYQQTHRQECNARTKAWAENNRERARAAQKRSRDKHHEELITRRREKYRKEPERHRAYTRKYRTKPGVAEREQQYRADYYQQNKAVLQASGRKQVQAWRQNPDNQRRMRERRQTAEFKVYNRVKAHQHRACVKSLPSTFTVDDWQRALDYFNGCCAVCGRQLNDLFNTHRAAADHWIPINSLSCPGTIPMNIVPLCHGKGGCNNSKHDNNPSEWLARQFGKRKATIIEQRIEEYFQWVVAQSG